MFSILCLRQGLLQHFILIVMLMLSMQQLGNRYYKQNNIRKAQEFYEKSFALGNKDTGIREIYVNSIINSPLDIESRKNLSGLQRTIFKTLPQ